MNSILQPGSRWELSLDAAAVISFVSALPLGISSGSHAGLWLLTAMMLAAGFRRRFPLAAACVAVVGSGLVAVFPETAIQVWVVAQVCIFTLTLRRSGRFSVVVPVVHAVVLYAAGLAALHLPAFEPLSFGLPLWTAAAASAGYALRSQKATIAALHETVRVAAEARDSEVRRTLGEERMRIARDLHDAVAHNIAVINVHAGAAEAVLQTDLQRAKESLEQVRAASRMVLAELQDILVILRSPGHMDDIGPLPTLEGIPALIETGRDMGLEIEIRHGDLPKLDSATEAALYRVIQEGLTSVHRHGNGRARIVLEAQDPLVALTISNGYGGSPPFSGSGHGLIGMRERVESAGGELTVEDHGGVFQLHVTLPNKTAKERQ